MGWVFTVRIVRGCVFSSSVPVGALWLWLCSRSLSLVLCFGTRDFNGPDALRLGLGSGSVLLLVLVFTLREIPEPPLSLPFLLLLLAVPNLSQTLGLLDLKCNSCAYVLSAFRPRGRGISSCLDLATSDDDGIPRFGGCVGREDMECVGEYWWSWSAEKCVRSQ